MPELPTPRWRFVKDAFIRPAGAVVAIPYAVWGALAFVRDEIVQPRNIALWKPIFWLSKLPWYAWLIATLVVAMIVLFEGSYRVVRKREMELLALKEAGALDVWLEGPVANTFTLHARGHASEIRVGPIATESAIVGTMKDGDRTMRTATPRHAIEFGVVSDLHDGEKLPMVPVLFFGEEDDPRHPRSAWPENEASKPALVQFLYNAKFVRSRENGEPDFRTISEAEIDAIAERRQQPFHFSFDITFWDSEHNEPWKRAELLVHEPDTNTTFVRRVGKPERLVAGAGDGPGGSL